MTNYNKILSNDELLTEARSLIERSRRQLAEMPEQSTQQQDTTRRHTMSTELTPQLAGELYASGQTVIEVARAHGKTYGQVRKLIVANGTPIRDASSRLKGRTRKVEA
jgi:transposase-like protein